jgi:glycosyltransferase involved in cell wall biosynthesis
MRIALVHDWLNNLGGAERVLIELHKIFPQAPIYALFSNKKFTREFLPEAEIKTSSLQKIPFVTRLYKYLLFLMPTAIESFDLSDFDVVISSSAIFSKGLVLKPKTRHICYCYSPTRQLWDLNTKHNTTWPKKVVQHLLRVWDRQASDRVDEFVAISKHVQSRIKKYYNKESKLIYPPIGLKPLASRLPLIRPVRSLADFRRSLSPSENHACSLLGSRFEASGFRPFYLIVSRLFPHKNIDIAIDAFNKIGYELVIVGDGPAKNELQNISGKNIKLVGFKTDAEIVEYYRNCKAFIMPQEEDFGLTPLEAMSFGKPVLALRKGGALETVVEGVTGEFFDDPIPEALADGIRRLNENYYNYNLVTIKEWAERFSREKFKEQILSLIKTTK